MKKVYWKEVIAYLEKEQRILKQKALVNQLFILSGGLLPFHFSIR